MKLFHSPTWSYISKIKVHIHPMHFCVSCTNFLRGASIGKMTGTHEGIYTVGLGAHFFCLVRLLLAHFHLALVQEVFITL